MKFTVANHALVPANTAAAQWMSVREIGEPIQVHALIDSEVKFRSFVFMALTKVADAAGMTLDQMRAKLQVETGRFQWLKIHNVSGPVMSVKSMNVMSMDHDELKEFWEDANNIIYQMLPTFAPEAAEEIEKLLRS